MSAKQGRDHFILATAVLLCAYIILYRVMEQELLSHSVYDSYTRQAQSWWAGRMSLPENVTWLELVFYNGQYYVSFPPFPSVIQFLLYPLFGLDTPDNLVNSLFGFGSFVLIYRYMMQQGHDDFVSSMTALLMTLGSNLFYISLTGWVWFSAQTQAFFFSVLAVYLINSKRQGAWYLSFLCLGFAFACRPPNVIYAPMLFYLLYQKQRKPGVRTFVRCVKYMLPLAAVGLAAAAYNMARFGNPIEFGHNYLEEFLVSPQFSLEYVPGNFLEILKLPGSYPGSFWPVFNGTLFFLVNPAYVLLGVRIAQRRMDRTSVVYLLCLLVHLVTVLAHKTMGGWQFGCRYLTDMLPFMLLIIGDNSDADGATFPRRTAFALTVLGIGINIWGAIWFYTFL